MTDFASHSPLIGRSVLVDDDVGVVRKAVFRFLSEAGARVYGVDLARLIREQWPATRVLFMSAFAAEVLVREGLDKPDVMFLAKPFTRDELMAKVSAAVSERQKRDDEKSRTGRPTS